MKRIKLVLAVILFSIMGTTTIRAQYVSDYMLDYGPGSVAWCAQMMQQENAIRMQNAMMQSQILNYYQQQAAAATQHLMNYPLQPMPGVLTYDGVYITPETVNDYTKEDVDCEHCSGGHNYRDIYVGGGESRRVRSTCSFCHGKGYVTKTVRK